MHSERVDKDMTLGEQIKFYRKQAGMTQQKLADKLGVSFEAVSNWERDKNVPTADNLQYIAEALNVTVDKLLGENRFEMKDRLFDEEHMSSFVSGKLDANFPMARKALDHIKDTRKNDRRIGRNDVPYIYHPLMMVCQAFAMQIADDELVTALLLHDALEVPGASRIDLPRETSESVKTVCELLVKKDRDIDQYFEDILKNPLACMVKLISRCSNLSTMTTGVSRTHMIRCVKETEKYYGKLLKVVRSEPKWNNAAWLLSYQIYALTEAYKKLL